MLIWKGAGIAVPIIFFITGWICSYFFEDTRLGNMSYVGTTMLFSALPVLLIGLGLSQPDENGVKRSHSFFFLPVALWGVIFIVGGIVLRWFL